MRPPDVVAEPSDGTTGSGLVARKQSWHGRVNPIAGLAQLGFIAAALRRRRAGWSPRRTARNNAPGIMPAPVEVGGEARDGGRPEIADVPAAGLIGSCSGGRSTSRSRPAAGACRSCRGQRLHSPAATRPTRPRARRHPGARRLCRQAPRAPRPARLRSKDKAATWPGWRNCIGGSCKRRRAVLRGGVPRGPRRGPLGTAERPERTRGMALTSYACDNMLCRR